MKKKRIPAAVRAAAAALGRRGGLVRNAKRAAASAANGKLGGAPRQYPVGTTPVQRFHLRNIAAQRGVIRTPAQAEAVTAVERLRAAAKKEQ